MPDFSHLPPGSRLEATGGATLVVEVENRPCKLPARGIAARHPGKGGLVMAAAKGRRGITAWVEAEGGAGPWGKAAALGAGPAGLGTSGQGAVWIRPKASGRPLWRASQMDIFTNEKPGAVLG